MLEEFYFVPDLILWCENVLMAHLYSFCIACMSKIFKSFRAKFTLWHFLVVLIFAFMVLVLAFYFASFHEGLSKENGDWGTFGDFFGGTLNPILTFISIVILVKTIRLQIEEQDRSAEFQKSSEENFQKQLTLQQEEYSRSVRAQEAAEQSLQLQIKTQKEQQIEKTFFSLLELHNQTLHAVFPADEALSPIKSLRANLEKKTSTPSQYVVKLVRDKNDIFGHYFRLLYQLLKFIAINCSDGAVSEQFKISEIEMAPVTTKEKSYANIVRSFLSYDVTQILALNCLCFDESDSFLKYMRLVERYEFLEHMPFYDGVVPDVILFRMSYYYDKKAFGCSHFLSSVVQSHRYLNSLADEKSFFEYQKNKRAHQ
ncbi:putative phage abortive infection protein [Chromobacterium sp.]|uniref:putative phage abortive infection protein n=1 Tax=Chromobacterium sp. TaxID=306190 RepID=UPI0035B2342D